MSEKQAVSTIDEYISQFPKEVQARLQEVRTLIKQNAPQAKEKISWGMPTLTVLNLKNKHENLIHFAAFKAHIGIYPGPHAIEAFLPLLEKYKTSKGAIQFPLKNDLPKELLRDIVLFRIKETQTE